MKYRILYQQSPTDPQTWIASAVACVEDGRVVVHYHRNAMYPEVTSLEELSPAHVPPMVGNLRWGAVEEREGDARDRLWVFNLLRREEPDVRLSPDEVRVAIWRWTPEEREALRRELAQEDDWAEAERAWQETLAADEAWVVEEEGAAVRDEVTAPALAAVAEEREAYRVEDGRD